MKGTRSPEQVMVQIVLKAATVLPDTLTMTDGCIQKKTYFTSKASDGGAARR